jgi:hypothetical protein
VIIARILTAFGLPKPDEEYRFDSIRRWRWDAAWPAWMVALEVQGGLWTRGKHVRGKGYINDMEKRTAGQLAGWLLVECTPQELGSGRIVPKIKAALEAKGWKG